MSKVKVPVYGTVGKAVFFDPDAGTRAEAAVEALAAAISAGNVGNVTYHRTLLGLQVGDDHPQYAMWQAPETIQGLWDFDTIPLIQGETLAEYIEDVVGSSFFDFIQDTPSIKWTYFDTDAELEANVDLDWAPVWTNNHRWTDNDEVQLGTGGDLRLYHDGTNSIIRNDTGYLQAQGSIMRVVPDSSAIPSAAINADSVLAVGRDSTSVSIGLVAPNGGSNGFRFVCASGGIAALAAINVASNSYLGYVGASGYDGTTWQTGAAGLLGIRPGSTWSGTNRETFLTFETTASGSTTRTERMRLTSDGNLRLLLDNEELQIGASQDLRFYHDGTNSIIRNDTGSLIISHAGTTAATLTANSYLFTPNGSIFRSPTAASEAVVSFEADSGFVADFRWRTRASVNRWLMRKDSTAESGSNAGSNWALVARADDGSNLGNAMTVFRATGAFALGFGASSHVSLGFDSQELRIGASGDLVALHDGTNSLIRNNTGELRLNMSGTTVGVRLTQDGRFYGTSLHNNAGAVTGATNQYIASGTYTPTLTNATNISASTARQCQWMRVGNVVTVSGEFDVDPTTTLLATELGISLPIASAFSTAFQCGGAANAVAIAGQCAGIDADATNDRARVRWTAGDVTNQTMCFSFTYEVL